MSYLIDTDVLSEWSKPVPEPCVADWLFRHQDELHLSVITLGEVEGGIMAMPGGKRRRSYEAWFARLEMGFRGRVLAVDREVMRAWSGLHAQAVRKGFKLQQMDSLIAATALRHQFQMVTGNERHFPPMLPVLNPWKL